MVRRGKIKGVFIKEPGEYLSIPKEPVQTVLLLDPLLEFSELFDPPVESLGYLFHGGGAFLDKVVDQPSFYVVRDQGPHDSACALEEFLTSIQELHPLILDGLERGVQDLQFPGYFFQHLGSFQYLGSLPS